MKAWTVFAAITGLAGAAVLGLRIRPHRIPMAAEPAPAGTVTLPVDLPAPAGWYPARICVRRADQARPWFVLDVDGVAVNTAVEPDLTAPPTAQRSGTAA
jgi:hypothetical protein